MSEKDENIIDAEILDENEEELDGSNDQYDVVQDIEITKEMKDAFLDYSMSVIVQRALPDVRDGMKPVHRRILYDMATLNMTPQSAHKKSARIVGDVLGKYHPHGDTAVYDAMVRMAQDFSYRYPLVDGHGNFGSLDGDGAAAMRYTEARMSKISMELVSDINKDTVDFVDTYDAETQEPVVLPSKVPNLLLNGSIGIAVGMATNIPPHNMNETVEGIKAVMRDPDISVVELMEYIKGPDFPTGGIIIGRKGIKDAYETGKGSMVVRAKYRTEPLPNGRKRVIYYEIPYNVNKMKLYEKMAEVIRDKKVNGVTYLNDESNREGIRIVMDLKKDVQEEVVINQMFRETPLQSTFNVNMLALENGRPKQLSLKNIIIDYIDHQVDVITRRTRFDLKKAEDRLHIVEGLRIALDHLDEVIALIRSSHKTEPNLILDMNEKFGLDEAQSKAILAMQIRRLSGLERDKLENEYHDLLTAIADYKDILANHSRVLKIIEDGLTEMAEKYGDARRTDIEDGSYDVMDEDLIPEEKIVLTLTSAGYMKATSDSSYHIQQRGGKGVKSASLNEEDIVEGMITLSNHDFVLLFTNLGKVYRMKGYQFPMGSRTSKGIPVVNFLPLQDGEKVETIFPYNHDEEREMLFFVTQNGIVKRTPVSEFKNINRKGKIAITLNEGDSLAFVKGTNGKDEIFIAGDNGKAIHFDEETVRPTGRSAAGVKGFNTDGGKVVGMALRSEGDTLMMISENGYGKRSLMDDYRKTSRGAKGVITMGITDKTGPLVAMKAVSGDEDGIIMTESGQVIRIHMDNVGTYGRSAQGVRVMKPADGDKVNRLSLIEHQEDEADDLVELPVPDQEAIDKEEDEQMAETVANEETV